MMDDFETIASRFVSPRILSDILDFLPITEKFILRRVCRDWEDCIHDLLGKQSFLRLMPADMLCERNNFWSDVGLHAIPTSLDPDELRLVLTRMRNLKTIWCEDASYAGTLLTCLRNLIPQVPLQLESFQAILDDSSLDQLCFEHNGSLTSLESLTIDFIGSKGRTWDFECFHELPNLTTLIIDANDKSDESISGRFLQRGLLRFLQERKEMPEKPLLFLKVTQRGYPAAAWLQREIDWHKIRGNVLVTWVSMGEPEGPEEPHPALDAPVHPPPPPAHLPLHLPVPAAVGPPAAAVPFDEHQGHIFFLPLMHHLEHEHGEDDVMGDDEGWNDFIHVD